MKDELEETIWLKPNQIIQYKGGGYDGCFWEWNFAYITCEGRYCGIITSGMDGCNTKEELEKKIEVEGIGEMWAADTTNKEEFASFMDEVNDTFVGTISMWFDANFPDVVPYTHCEECGVLVPAYDTSTTGYRGAGGIAIEGTGRVCRSCRINGECDKCGEYYGKENVHYYESLGAQLCKDCLPEITVVELLDTISKEVSSYICKQKQQLTFSGNVDENIVWPITEITPFPDQPNAKTYKADDFDLLDVEDDLFFGFLFYLDGIKFYAELNLDEYTSDVFLKSKKILTVTIL